MYLPLDWVVPEIIHTSPWKVFRFNSLYPWNFYSRGVCKDPPPPSSLQCYPLERKLDLSPLFLGISNSLLLDGAMDIFWNYTFA